MNRIPRVGIGVFILHRDRFLIGKRKNAHGEGSWGLPGGHLEFGESFEDAAMREVLEETGLAIGDVRYSALTNDIFEMDDKHYVTIFMLSSYIGGEPQVLEPDRMEEWQWRRLDDMPNPLFIPLSNLLKNNFNPFTHDR